MSDIKYFMYKQMEIISNVEKDTSDETIILKSPRVLQIHMTGPGQAGVAFVPLFAGNPDGKIRMKVSDIGPESLELPVEVENAYLQQTSGIQIASGGIMQ